MAELAHSLAVHLQENWPIQGQGQPVAGPPTNVTASNLYRHLMDLQTLLFRFHPPARPADEFAWLQMRIPVLDPNVAAAMGNIKLVCDNLIDQFGFQAAFATVDGTFKVVLTPTLNTSRLWEHPLGRPLPQINPQDIRSLAWAAAKLLLALEAHRTGHVQPASPAAREDWLPASKAIQLAAESGYDITLDWISKRKDKLRTRPAAPGSKHKLEVESGSLAQALFNDPRLKPVKTIDADEPDHAERVAIKARTQTELERKLSI